MDIISNNLDKDKREIGKDIMDKYYFSVFGIGENEYETTNFIKVIVVPRTCNIVNMYPVSTPNFKNLKYLDIDYDRLFKRDKNVKKLSRIERFNKRYNK